jgi:hypothetical protein
MLTSAASSMVWANMRVPAGKSLPVFSSAGGMETHTGASGISSARRRAGFSSISMAAESSGPTAKPIRSGRMGKNEILRSGVLPLMRQKASRQVPPCSRA